MLLLSYKPFLVYSTPYLLHRHTLDAGRIVYVSYVQRSPKSIRALFSLGIVT